MPLRPSAIKVEPIHDYHVLIEFDNKEKKLLDVSYAIKGPWYGKLQDCEYFKTVHCDGFTIAWEEGQDLCPDDIYYLSRPCNQIG